MKTLGNLLWLIFGGLLLSILWVIAGIICCITLIGIPIGLQCFKFADYMLHPFGRDVVFGSGTVSFILNVLWLVFFGWELALTSVTIGLVWCVTIVGIPFGLQCFKFAKLAIMPFEASIVNI